MSLSSLGIFAEDTVYSVLLDQVPDNPSYFVRYAVVQGVVANDIPAGAYMQLLCWGGYFNMAQVLPAGADVDAYIAAAGYGASGYTLDPYDYPAGDIGKLDDTNGVFQDWSVSDAGPPRLDYGWNDPVRVRADINAGDILVMTFDSSYPTPGVVTLPVVSYAAIAYDGASYYRYVDGHATTINYSQPDPVFHRFASQYDNTLGNEEDANDTAPFAGMAAADRYFTLPDDGGSSGWGFGPDKAGAQMAWLGIRHGSSSPPDITDPVGWTRVAVKTSGTSIGEDGTFGLWFGPPLPGIPDDTTDALVEWTLSDAFQWGAIMTIGLTAVAAGAHISATVRASP